ncbi:MAG: 7-cyano-7-deazaguanine synthase QueC [Opitutales bacterium]|nr:7-cyano-7-deazaguanine synthase QueC [Opitutales bacterium]
MKTVLIYSGGLDSTVLLHHLASTGSVAEAVSVNYGQKHFKELEFAAENCRRLGVPHRVIDLSSLSDMFGDCALTSPKVEVPDGSYAPENMSATVVPNRNMILLSFAAARAIAKKCDAVAYAAHGGDHALYADCTPEFADAMAGAIRLADARKIELLRPFINMAKAQIVSLGAKLGVDFSLTWSCYKGGERHCGKCGTCSERRQAFIAAGVPDPTAYED